jgi:hypothetical protein
VVPGTIRTLLDAAADQFRIDRAVILHVMMAPAGQRTEAVGVQIEPAGDDWQSSAGCAACAPGFLAASRLRDAGWPDAERPGRSSK